jgi:exodeoxyribonuclease VII small subunit
MEKLEDLVNRIQRGDMGLEEMRGEVKAALELIRQCRVKLREIETDLDSLLEEEE